MTKKCLIGAQSKVHRQETMVTTFSWFE